MSRQDFHTPSPLARQLFDRLVLHGLQEQATALHFDFGATPELTVQYRIAADLSEPFLVAAEIKPELQLWLSNLLPNNQTLTIPTVQGKARLTGWWLKQHGQNKLIVELATLTHTWPALSDLGWADSDYALVEKILGGGGAIIIAAEAGQGKTSTAAAWLKALALDNFNVYCLSAKEKLPLDSAQHLSIGPRLTWHQAWQAVLGQDADVVFLDEPPADLNLNLWPAGKLIIVSLAATDIGEAWQKTKSLGLAEQAKLLINQKLAKRLCPDCRFPFALNEQLKNELLNDFDLDEANDLTFYHGAGCPACAHQGHSGQIGVFSLIRLTGEAHKLNSEELAALAERTLLEDAFDKALSGQLTLEELKKLL